MSFGEKFKDLKKRIALSVPWSNEKGDENGKSVDNETGNQSDWRGSSNKFDEFSVSSRDSGQLTMGVGEFPSPILDMDSQPVGSLPDLSGEALPDPQPLDESELGSVESQKHVLLHILSQLKFGMDLTRIVLPTFILEKRSLLEMIADYMAHPDLFIKITQGENPEERMLAFVHWYLTSFHAGRKDRIAKKPYNPIIGESFHCGWRLSDCIDDSNCDSGDQATAVAGDMLLVYCAEQVSHHPPVTAFHFNCPRYQMQLNSSVHSKSKFQGMSISVTMIGKTVLRLGQHHGEEYHFAFPTAYARSILSVPWVELGDKISIHCPQTGYSATINFHTKPMRGNKLHRVTADIFGPVQSNIASASPNPTPIYHVAGQWNGILEFEQLVQPNRRWSVDVTKLPIRLKCVLPLDKQRPEESRRLWYQVTEALRSGDLQLATEKKRELEERQRISEKYRVRQKIPFPVKYFEWDGTTWNFRFPDS